MPGHQFGASSSPGYPPLAFFHSLLAREDKRDRLGMPAFRVETQRPFASLR